MNIYKLKYKLDSIKLNDNVLVIKKQIETRFDNIDLNSVELSNSEFLGFNMTACNDNNKRVFLLSYYDDAILYLHEAINHYGYLMY